MGLHGTVAEAERPRVVIIGAGFGGLWAVRGLAQSALDVVLVERHNYHTFPALLYQVAAAELAPGDIAYPVRSILQSVPNARFVMGHVRRVDTERRVVETDALAISYDFLVLATGSETHFFGVPGALEHAFPLKTLSDAIALRNHTLGCFERAVHEADVERRQQLLTFTIVGGGPTAVEYAGALSELIHGPLAKDYPTLDVRKVRVLLVEAQDHLLPALPGTLGSYAMSRLRQMGVDVRVRSTVSRITPEMVYLQEGEPIATATAVWTAGVRAAPQAGAWGLPTVRGGRVQVLPTLQVPGHDEVYAVGDLAYLEEGNHALPMVAPVAIQQGVMAAKNITRQMSGLEPLPFQYRDRGTMATIGRNAAAAHVGNRAFTGFPAWLLWLGVHLFNLIGFRNRVLVLINWAWDYLLRERPVRLIVPSDEGAP